MIFVFVYLVIYRGLLPKVVDNNDINADSHDGGKPSELNGQCSFHKFPFGGCRVAWKQ